LHGRGPAREAETGYRSEVASDGAEIVWTVRGAGENSVARIQALGFFGPMATSDHPRMHHLAIARDEQSH